MKILDDWKVYGGVSDLKQHAEGIPVSQVIINSNYSDDHDDYDIALMKLSRPLTLSGQGSHLAVLRGWCLGDRERLRGMGRSKRQLGSPWSRPLGCMGLLPAGASRSAVATLLSPAWPVVRNRPVLPRQGPTHAQPWAQLRSLHRAAHRAPHGQCGGGTRQRPCLGGCRGECFLHTTLLPSCRASDYNGYFAPG